MRSGFHNALLQEETRYKDAVYHAPDEEIQAAKENVSDKCAEVRRGAYKNLNAVNRRVQSLYARPFWRTQMEIHEPFSDLEN